MDKELWIEGQDDIMNAPAAKQRGWAAELGQHIGCPLKWFVWVYPVVRGKNELAVALYLYRLRSIQHSRTVKVSNMRLLTELGIDRYAKYRALKHLAAAGVITVRRRPHRSLEIVFHQSRAKTERLR
jgi:hypothetical protein